MNSPESDHLQTHPAPKVKVLPMAPVKVRKGVGVPAVSRTTAGFRPKVSTGTQAVRVAQSMVGTNTGLRPEIVSATGSGSIAEASAPITKKGYSFLWDIAFAAVALVFSCLILLKY